MYDIENCTINGKHSYFLEYYNKAIDDNDDSVIIGQELLQCLENCICDLGGILLQLYKFMEQKIKTIFYNINFEGVIKLMNKDILITKEMLLVWNVKNVEQQNIVKMDL